MEESKIPQQTVIHDISFAFLLKVFGFVIGIILIYFLRDVLISLFIAVILMSAIAPLVGILREKLRIPTIWAIAISYVLAISFVGTLVYLVFPPLLKEITNFFNDLPRYTAAAMTSLGIVETAQQQNLYQNNILPLISERASQVAQGALGITIQLFSGIIEIVTVAVFTFYLLLEREQVEGSIVRSIPFIKATHRKKYMLLFDEIQSRLGAWARGQLALCFIIGIITYICLLILGVPFALPLAVIAGVLEMVPTIGPIIASFPALVIVLAVEPSLFFFIAALYIIIQQLENSLIVPQVMKRAVGFSPLVTIVAIMVGGRLLGVAGALLAIPFCVVVYAIAQNYKKIESSIQVN